MKNILLFAFPLMLSNLLQIAFNAADTVIVGRFSGQQALAAVGSTGSIVSLMVSLFNGMSTGASIVLAQSIGSGVRERIKASIHTAYFLVVFGGLILTGVGLSMSPYFLTLTGTPADIMDKALLYMRIYFIGSIPLLAYNAGAAIMRAKGDTLRPTVFLTVAGITNVVLNLICVIWLKMGVAGVAIATVVSESISAVLIANTLMHENDDTRLILREISLDVPALKRILAIGIPSGLQGMMWAISNVAVQSSINSFGSVTVAGNTAAANIEQFVNIGMGCFNQSCMTFTSQNAGAKNCKRIKQILRLTTVLITAATFTIGSFIFWQDDFILSLYTTDPAVIEVGKVRIAYVIFWLFLNGILDIPAASMRGMGYSAVPTSLMLIGIVGVRIGWLRFYWATHRTLEVLYMCYPLSWSVTIVLQFTLWMIIYRRFARDCQTSAFADNPSEL